MNKKLSTHNLQQHNQVSIEMHGPRLQRAKDSQA